MNKLGIQDTFEPYYEGRKGAFPTVKPKKTATTKQAGKKRKPNRTGAKTSRQS